VTADELWSVAEVAEYLGAASAGSARKTLSRWGIVAADYRPDETSGRVTARFRAAEVRAAFDARPGQGARTDRTS
jgi:hypothetical protein